MIQVCLLYARRRNKGTAALAQAPGVEDVLNPLHTPTTDEDKFLFDEKQNFMYAVFEHTLQTDQGKAFVHAWEASYDTQKVHSELVNYSI
jgi:hypothetical protein